MRVVESSIDHANQPDAILQMDRAGQSIIPAVHDIEFKNVSFSYDQKRILHNISIHISNKTTTAIIRPSRFGKMTTISLMFRNTVKCFHKHFVSILEKGFY